MMTKALLAFTTAGAIFAATLPASALTGRFDPSLGASSLPVTQVQYRDGHRWRHGGAGWNHGGPGWRHGSPGWQHGRGWRGGDGWRHHRRGIGIGAGVAGLAAGALIGGAIASQAAPVYAAPGYGGDTTAYCMQRFKSYDPGSGTYLGYDGLRHPCP